MVETPTPHPPSGRFFRHTYADSLQLEDARLEALHDVAVGLVAGVARVVLVDFALAEQVRLFALNLLVGPAVALASVELIQRLP